MLAASLAGATRSLAADSGAVSAKLQSRVDACIDSYLDDWIGFYKASHRDPELSNDEMASSTRVADALFAAGVEITRDVGGHGVVGVIRNGDGPVLLIRGDMDALPITEDTGLPFASHKKVTRTDGTRVGVMHACGHDVHQTVLIGTARALSATRDHWHGTVVLVAQPAEEIGQGARRMIDDGLFKKFPKPQNCIALHCAPDLRAGTVGYTSGWALANVDSVDITIYGRGGHGAYPHKCIDPIVAGSQLVMALQTIVSRRIDPRDAAVVTVGSFHAGAKHNVIPDTAKLQLTVRSYGDETRQKLLDSIRQISTDICKAAGCPKPPEVKVLEEEYTPATYNDPALARQAGRVFRDVLGPSNVVEMRPVMGGEDFGRYAPAAGGKGFMFWLGIVDKARYDAAQKPGADSLPPLHSSKLCVDPEPTIRTGVRAMTNLALSLLEAS